MHTPASFADPSSLKKTKIVHMKNHSKHENISSVYATMNITRLFKTSRDIYVPTEEGIKALTTHIQQSEAFTMLSRLTSDRKTPQFDDEPEVPQILLSCLLLDLSHIEMG